jgi:Ca2+-binding EF-hand superfamily protein
MVGSVPQAGLQMSKKEMAALLKAADADGDKKISLTEYVSVFADDLKKRVSPAEEESLRKQFALLDNNGDGYISKSELRKSAQLLQFTSAQLVETLKMADMDGDGTISFEEFVSLMQ